MSSGSHKMNKRLTFAVIGEHPLLNIITTYLITNRLLMLVEPYDNPDFCIVGAHTEDPNITSNLLNILSTIPQIPAHTPMLVLSSSAVYSDRDTNLDVIEKSVMSEDHPTLLLSSFDVNTSKLLFSLLIENTVLSNFSSVLVLRMFDIYGKTTDNFINVLLQNAKNKEVLKLETPGYQVRTFLHLDDFFEALDKIIPKLVKNKAIGIYNIGSSEEISLKRLADSIWQLTNPTEPIKLELIQASYRQKWWSIPDITRIQALLNWKPKITIRKGLWTLVNEDKNAINK